MPGITILGLGPGHPDWLTREAWRVLESAPEIYLRTARHPTVEALPVSVTCHSFDHFYEQAIEFDEVYAAIVAEVLRLGARPQGVLYAVPGHPSVGEATVQSIRTQAAAHGLLVQVVAGLSFIEPALAALNVDALPNLQLADALDVATRHHPLFHPDAPVLIAQLYSAGLASDVKLTLMAQYPDEHDVVLIHAVGTPDERLEHVPLFEIDQSEHIAHLTALYVPPLPQAASLEAFQDTITHLRAPDGCPWDKEQTHQTLRAHLLEETYEALAALDADDPAALREELGDLLLQIVMHAVIAAENGDFNLAEVIAQVRAKIIRRHPHVFGAVQVSDAGEVLQNWEAIKAAERQDKKQRTGLLSGVPLGLPALAQATEYQARAARVGFDWPVLDEVIAKAREEWAELEAATTPDHRAEELGDLLFVMVNWARWLKIDPEAALRQANTKFGRRFGYIEQQAAAQGRDLKSMTLVEMDALWNQAKQSLL